MQGLMSALVNSVLFSVLGVIVFWASFMALDKVTPYNLWREICEQKNVALAIVVGAMALGISTIIAAAIHG
jgi:uncharacterized membrane protein YjfL (UPF0719 family)